MFNESTLRRNLPELLQGRAVPLITGWDAERDEAIVEQIPPFILADSGFANTDRVVTTFDMRQIQSSPIVRKLNHRLSAMRYNVECAFGLLNGRFKILRRPLDCAVSDVRRAAAVFASLFVLHNFAIAHGDVIDEQDQETMTADYREMLRRRNVRGEPGTPAQECPARCQEFQSPIHRSSSMTDFELSLWPFGPEQVPSKTGGCGFNPDTFLPADAVCISLVCSHQLPLPVEPGRRPAFQLTMCLYIDTLAPCRVSICRRSLPVRSRERDPLLSDTLHGPFLAATARQPCSDSVEERVCILSVLGWEASL